MENWVYDRRTIKSFARHYSTGNPLPDELFEKMKAARNFHAGRNLLNQLYLGALDLCLHSDYDSQRQLSEHQITSALLQYLQSDESLFNQFLLQPLHPIDQSLWSFSHIFGGGYAAGYYSYIWAEVMSADAFVSFEEQGLDNEEAVKAMGVRFRDTVLARGAEQEAADVFREFKGRDASPLALLKHRGILSSND